MKQILMRALLCLLLAGCGGGEDGREETTRSDLQPVDCHAPGTHCL